MYLRSIGIATIIVVMIYLTPRFDHATAVASLWSPVAALTNPNELLVFDVNRAVTTDDRGFPRNDPPRAEANGDWTTPINFAEGTFYFLVHVRSQPVSQAMRLQFCIWQDNFNLENCAPMADVRGDAGTVVTWEKPVQELWKKNDRIIDWSRPRQRYGFAIKNEQGQAVSDYNGWNWHGEDPAAWYPLDVQLSVVVVAAGATFSGWQNYVAGLPPTTPTPAATQTPIQTSTVVPTATPPLPTATQTRQPTATATVAATSTAMLTPTPTTLTIVPTPEQSATVTPSPTHTVVVPEPTKTVSAGDLHEPNDSCTESTRIAVDAAQQEHTLHVSTDVDWVQFDVVAGRDYRIRVITTAAVVADLLAVCESSDGLVTATHAAAPELRIDFHAGQSGAVFLRIRPQEQTLGAVISYGVLVRQIDQLEQSIKVFLPLITR